MAVSVYDRASDSMCPTFFGIFRSSCFVSIRYNPHRRWQTNQVEAKLALKAASIEPPGNLLCQGRSSLPTSLEPS
jgi:hypothetical protein